MTNLDQFPTICAVDPGGHTGVAIGTKDQVLVATTFDNHMEAVTYINKLLDPQLLPKSVIDEVVCETYVINAGTIRKTRQYEPLEVIGALRYLCFKHNIPYSLQTQSDAKRFATNETLDEKGWLLRPLKEHVHANDSLRHLYLRHFGR